MRRNRRDDTAPEGDRLVGCDGPSRRLDPDPPGDDHLPRQPGRRGRARQRDRRRRRRRQRQQADDGRPHRAPTSTAPPTSTTTARGADSLPLDAMLGRRRSSSSPHRAGPIDAAALRGGRRSPPATERLLLKTPNSRLWDRDEFTHDFVRLDGSGAELGARARDQADRHRLPLDRRPRRPPGAARRRRRRARGPRPARDRARAPTSCSACRSADRHRRSARAGRCSATSSEVSGRERRGARRDRPRRDEDPGDRRRLRQHGRSAKSRRPTPHEGGPHGRRRRRWRRRCGEAANAAGVETAALKGVGVGSPGEIEAKAGIVSNAKNLPDWGGSFPLGPAPRRGAGHAGGGRQRRQRRDQGGGRARRRTRPQLGPRRLLGHRRRRRDRPRRRALARARVRRRDRPHGRQARRGQAARAATGAAWRPTPGARAMEAEARRRVEARRQDATCSS